ncbi:tetraacyldisaccharide 4'-kinase [Planctomicrobium sp. SH661]|uniref:tetraacyldisaccharide 4'-kinase n=1 Tax=Planctomicrobium sp. SH661 TaxID=3448124 RepID=UPI003F5B4909
MNRYFDIISGKDREWSADLIRYGLTLCSLPYAVVTEVRNRCYDFGILPVRSVPVPVLSIGNLTTGGTGKTPAVAWLANLLKSLGQKPAIVSRGYRSLDGEENDEKRLLDDLCPGIPHLQNPKRSDGAQAAIRTHGANVIVLDDGYQHRKLHRDLDIVLIDVLNPWGYNALLPRGLLRERIGQLSRADVILLTRCELTDAEHVDQLTRKIRRYSSAPVLRTAFQATRFINFNGEFLSLGQAADRPSLAFCGIGNPDGFRRTLTTLASAVSQNRFLTFPDHHHYQESDLLRIQQQTETNHAELLLTTRKDLVKICQDRIGDIPLWALDIELTFLDDASFLTGLLRTLLPDIHHSPASR